MPGLAKTLAIKTLAQLMDARFSRIRSRPTLLPADVIGTQIYIKETKETFSIKDPYLPTLCWPAEINRAPAKVQSALLEAMQERQVTIAEETFKPTKSVLGNGHQNPIDQKVPTSCPKRRATAFMMKVIVGYPTKRRR